MLMLLGTESPRLWRGTLAETIGNGRAMLCQINGKDFVYDLHEWHIPERVLSVKRWSARSATFWSSVRFSALQCLSMTGFLLRWRQQS